MYIKILKSRKNIKIIVLGNGTIGSAIAIDLFINHNVTLGEIHLNTRKNTFEKGIPRSELVGKHENAMNLYF